MNENIDNLSANAAFGVESCQLMDASSFLSASKSPLFLLKNAREKMECGVNFHLQTKKVH